MVPLRSAIIPRRGIAELLSGRIGRCAIVAVSLGVAAGFAGMGVAGSATKPKTTVPKCNKLVTPGSVLNLIDPGGTPGIKVQKVVSGRYSYWGDARDGTRGGPIPFTGCWYSWKYVYGQTPPTGDPLPSTVAPPSSYVIVGRDATLHEWENIRHKEATEPGGDGDGCSGDCSWQPLRTIKINKKVKAFLVTWGNFGTAPDNARYQWDYEIFVYTAHKNIVEISIWPATLSELTTFVQSVLKHHPKF